MFVASVVVCCLCCVDYCVQSLVRCASLFVVCCLLVVDWRLLLMVDCCSLLKFRCLFAVCCLLCFC